MAVQNFTPSPAEVDLEATAELPAIDFAGTATDIASTDVHVAPGIPAGVAELAASLREAELRLARKMERVAGLEGDLANALRSAVELRAQLDHEGAQATRRDNALREAEQQLAQKSERIAVLETGLASEQRAVLEQRTLLDQERLQGAQRERVLSERGLEFEKQLAELRQKLEARDAAQRHQAAELLDLRRRNECSLEALQTWHGFRGVADAQLHEHDARLLQAEAQNAAQLAAVEARNAQQLAQAEARTAQLQAQLGAALEAAQKRVTALEESLRVAQAANEEGKSALQTQQQLNQSLQAQLDAAVAKSGEVEEDLRMAEEHIHRLESEAHASATLLGNLQQNVERLARDDTGSRPMLRVVTTEPAPRVLIRQVDGVDVVYPLGRRTTIGRTPDNDIQVDTTFISRHHAVLLSNPDQCVVEDLNSTNGVMVNGRPVSRQALRDGDTLTVGKSDFRYQQHA